MQGVTQEGVSKPLPLALDLQFTIQARRTFIIGTGRTVLMSSKEIVFRSDRAIPLATNLKLAISWPVKLENHVGLQLTVDGFVTRAQGDFITVSIGRYQFRTRSHAKERPASTQTAASPQAGLPVRSWMVAREAHAW
jgi:hypothetical protein